MNAAEQAQHRETYGFAVGDQVTHVRDDSVNGYVTELDADHDLGDVTTCRVVWGANSFEEAKNTPRDEQDIQWTIKLMLAEEEAE